MNRNRDTQIERDFLSTLLRGLVLEPWRERIDDKDILDERLRTLFTDFRGWSDAHPNGDATEFALSTKEHYELVIELLGSPPRDLESVQRMVDLKLERAIESAVSETSTRPGLDRLIDLRARLKLLEEELPLRTSEHSGSWEEFDQWLSALPPILWTEFGVG